jgi:hypothetical protein
LARKEKKYHFIYKTTNLLSGRYYIGAHSTDDLDDGYLGSGNRLRRAIKKHGKENFSREILEFCESREDLYERECEIVNLDEIAKEECINLTVGGFGGSGPGELGNKRFKELLETDEEFRVSFSNKMRNTGLTRVKNGDILFGGKSFNWNGKNLSEETKKKLSEAKKGKGKGESNSQYGTCWITNGEEVKKIKKEELPQYESEGWQSGRKIKEVYYCKECGDIKKSKGSAYCNKCARKLRVKVKPPACDILLEEVRTTSQSAVARKYGVSHTTIQNWLKGNDK